MDEEKEVSEPDCCWTVLCGESREPLSIATEVFHKIPFFATLAQTEMRETLDKVVVKPDITLETMQVVIKLVGAMLMTLKSEQMKEEYKYYIFDNITISTPENVIQARIAALSPEIKRKLDLQLAKEARIKQLRAILSPASDEEAGAKTERLENVRLALDQLLLIGLAVFVEKENKPTVDLLSSLEEVFSSTCAHFFGGRNGCRYGKACKFRHTCPHDKRQKVINDAVEYLRKKGQEGFTRKSNNIRKYSY